MRAYTLIVPAMVVLLWGCASRIPADIDTAVPESAPSITAARTNPDQHLGQTVRWGGDIVSQENRADVTLLEVIGRELESGARPREGDASNGRFLAIVEGFLDPAIYERGRQLTVVGELDGIDIRKVGDYDYPYPRVVVRAHHLWQPRPDNAVDYRSPHYWPDPWHYDPWHRRPWYPRYHPYYRR